ncbi:MAG: hypothetical protein MUC43_09810 [Pirellula sp.]|nr:hypothetical protein [Pirellula sp.]
MKRMFGLLMGSAMAFSMISGSPTVRAEDELKRTSLALVPKKSFSSNGTIGLSN